MKKIKTISKTATHTAVEVGSLNTLTEYSLVHPKTKQEMKGKVFLKDITDATGTEISFSTLAPNTTVPYFHIHFENEETYVILKGKGEFQVDDVCFPITEGSVIRVAPKGNRCLRNSSLDQELVYMVIQSKENSLHQYSSADGERMPCTSLFSE